VPPSDRRKPWASAVRVSGDSGFSLLDALLACTILTVGVVSLAHLFALATALNAASRRATLAAVLAAQKLEILRTAPLVASAVESVETVAADGEVLDAAGGAPLANTWIRRWTIEPLPADPDHTVVVEVRVGRATAIGDAPRWDARLLTVRSRKDP
jgi:hypothetical protein